MDLSAFHFLRPIWLLAMLPGFLLPLIRRARRRAPGIEGAGIAAHLSRHLLLGGEQGRRLRPIHLISALLLGGALAAAGPTWKQDRPAFLEDRAPLIFALDLSASMDASDVPPTRLDAARYKLRELVHRRAGARTCLIAFAGSAHLVLPPTADTELLDSFGQALSSGMIEHPGKNLLAVVELAQRLLATEAQPGTLVIATDGADRGQFKAIRERLSGSALQVLILAVGQYDGGMLRDATGQPRVDGNGRPLLGSFDKDALESLADAADAPIASLRVDSGDLDWIERHAEQHLRSASGEQAPQWQDAGYWLCWPLALLALGCIRRGWNLSWAAALLLAIGLAGQAQGARAEPFDEAFMSADQQGRWAFEQGRYAQAAARFEDPYWKGLAAYRAADYPLALESFARLQTAPAYFYLGNVYCRLWHFGLAIAAYRQALVLQPVFPEAQANLQLALALQQDYEDAQANAPQQSADKVEMDLKGQNGKDATLQHRVVSEERWLQNLDTSPAQFLRRKFQLQDARAAQVHEDPR
ncbi:VWA domain-containing protein [Pseudomonas sp. NPDC086581]|uniref:VWA domain-containing protein n=1 Tax=Pseudomonas sp. NPDC086581 TaxID=3364432 RepID=UPI0037F4C61E